MLFSLDSQGRTLAPGPLPLSFVLASSALVHRKLESDFSAKAAESTTEMERGGGGELQSFMHPMPLCIAGVIFLRSSTTPCPISKQQRLHYF